MHQNVKARRSCLPDTEKLIYCAADYQTRLNIAVKVTNWKLLYFFCVAEDVKGKGNAVHVQAYQRTTGFRELEGPRFLESRHTMVVRLSALRTGSLYLLHDHPWYFVCSDLLDAVGETSYGGSSPNHTQSSLFVYWLINFYLRCKV
jgi:hypothetical protein